jgi:hypothetical protein
VGSKRERHTVGIVHVKFGIFGRGTAEGRIRRPRQTDRQGCGVLDTLDGQAEKRVEEADSRRDVGVGPRAGNLDLFVHITADGRERCLVVTVGLARCNAETGGGSDVSYYPSPKPLWPARQSSNRRYPSRLA